MDTANPTSTKSLASSQEISSPCGLSPGPKIGIGIGVAAGVLLLVFTAFILLLRYRATSRRQKALGPNGSRRGEYGT